MLSIEERLRFYAERDARAQAIRDRIAAAGIKRPINWDEMGSSEKDLWEEGALRAIARRERRQEQAR